MTTTQFTEAEAAAILEKLDGGTLTHEIARDHECSPSDIWALWDERNRAR